MTQTFYIDTTGVNGRQLVKLCSAFYGIHPQIHIVDQTNQCDVKSNKIQKIAYLSDYGGREGVLTFPHFSFHN